MSVFLLFILLMCSIFILYHHVIYYPVMIWVGLKQKQSDPPTPSLTTYPNIAIILSVYNEEKWVGTKLKNLLDLDYPNEKITYFIASDGCTDRTVKIINQHLPTFIKKHRQCVFIQDNQNKGKLFRLNQMVNLARPKHTLLAFTDTSTRVESNALHHALSSFENTHIGAVTSYYQFAAGNTEEKAYWAWQNHVRLAESYLGNVIGGSGAFYIMRSAFYQPLPLDTINDDFMLPMMVIKKGKQVQLNQKLYSTELESTPINDDYQRRERIGAGNLQQILRCHFLFSHPFTLTHWLFWSGKGLRTLMPILLILSFLSSLLLTIQQHPLGIVFFILQFTAYALIFLPMINPPFSWQQKLRYVCLSYGAAFVGMFRYTIGHFDRGWHKKINIEEYKNRLTVNLKRFFDILLSIIGLLLTLPLWPFIAFAIKWESKGDVFFYQLRVGEIFHDHSRLFCIIKFRTMQSDPIAEKKANWANPNDPRITRVGQFLRRTRLDELPQFINVLKGDMSMIGPRPERPIFYHQLSESFPFYIERTSGLKPGLTGLAQVNQGYDNTLDDVKKKLLWDHAYAAVLGSPWQWFITDLTILWQTAIVMIKREGQ
jgi:lipopolysaccharide/colanic/teichoic acid biosynthesis glycosyltransferase